MNSIPLKTRIPTMCVLRDALRNQILGIHTIGWEGVSPAKRAQNLGYHGNKKLQYARLSADIRTWEQHLNEQENFEQETASRKAEDQHDVDAERAAGRQGSEESLDGLTDSLIPVEDTPFSGLPGNSHVDSERVCDEQPTPREDKDEWGFPKL